MRFRGVHLFALSLLFLSSGCLKDGEVLVDDLANVKAQVFKVENQNGKLVIEGKNLNATQKVRIKGNSIDNEMVIQSKSKTRIVAALSQAITFTASAVYELVLSNAYGQSVYQLSFEIQDGQVTTVKLANGAVTGDKISDMGALSGQILKYNGTTWSPADLNSLVYAGTWDASTGTEPNSSPVGGDFWIVDTDGDVDLGDGNGVRQWRIGDWIVYNSFTGQWDQVISSQSVVSFNGRAGEVTAQANDYTWQQIDKTLAPIDDLTDVDTATTPPANGEVLKWDGSNWTPQVDADSGGDITEVNAGTGLLGGATSGSATLDIDVGTGAGQIPQLDASGLLLNSIIPGLDTSKITSGTMNTTRLPYASSTTDGIISSSDYQTFSGTDTTLSNGAAGEYLDGDGSWYVLDNAAVGLGNVTNDQQIPASSLDTNTNLGTDDTLVPSQNAVKTYVDSSVSTASNDYLLRDGTQAMTGNFDGGANELTNISNATLSSEFRLGDLDDTHYVGLKAPDTVTTSYVWKLPAAEGGAGQVLSTDGSGSLTWASSGDGSVTDVTATLPLSSSGTNTPDISIAQSNSTTDGYLSSTDWNTFNDKQNDLNAPADATQYLDGTETWQTLNTDAVTEAGNKYFTDSRAQTAVVTQTITNAVTTTSPSEDAVFDALADKADASSLANYVLKGGDTMTGPLNLPADGLTVGTDQIVTSGGNVGIGEATPTTGKLSITSDVTDEAKYTLDTDLDILATTNGSYSGIGQHTWVRPQVQSGVTNSGRVYAEALRVKRNTSTVGDDNGTLANMDGIHLMIGHSSDNAYTPMTTSVTGITVAPYFGSGTIDNYKALYLQGPVESGATVNNQYGVYQQGSAQTNFFAGNIGIGTASPDTILTTANASPEFSFLDTSAGDRGSIHFQDGNFEFWTNTTTAGEPSTTGSQVLRVQKDGNVGVGTSAPNTKLHVEGNTFVKNRLFVYDSSAWASTTPSISLALGDNDTGLNWVSDGVLQVYTNNAVRMHYTSSGNVGVGTTTPSYKLDVNGTLRAYGITDSSDRRLKEQIRPLKNSLDKVTQLQGVEYFWRDRSIDSELQIGLIAQDIEKVFPELVKTDPSGMKSVNYSHLVAPLIESIKELRDEKDRENRKQDRKIASLERANEKLQEENSRIRAQNAEIKSVVCTLKPEASFCSRGAE